MKKPPIILIGIVVIILSWLSEMALSMIDEKKWSNYVFSWETKWPTSLKEKPDVKPKEPVVTVCSDKK